MSAGLMPVSLLSWSPNGEYVLEGGLDGSFRIWETHKWTDALWISQVCCRLSFQCHIVGHGVRLCPLKQIEPVAEDAVAVSCTRIVPSALSGLQTLHCPL